MNVRHEPAGWVDIGKLENAKICDGPVSAFGDKAQTEQDRGSNCKAPKNQPTPMNQVEQRQQQKKMEFGGAKSDDKPGQ